MNDKEIISANSILWATSISLTFFWILNILKESFKGVKDLLNFYSPVGPLLGLFIFSTLVLIIAFIIFKLLEVKDQKSSFFAVLISSAIFLLMVFPPIFKIVVDFFTD